MNNKAIFRFFTRLIGLPSGKKSTKAHIPGLIKILEPKPAVPFLAGLIDSDIGKHSSGMGCTFGSEKLMDDLVIFIGNLGVKAKKGGTYIIKNKYPQTDFRIPKSEIRTLKYVLEQNYLPERADRLKLINGLAGMR